MELNLTDRVAIVTGAGQNIGREIALTLAREGARIGINDYFEDRARNVVDEIKAGGGEAIPLKADVTRAEEIKDMVKKVIESWGRVDILVNNAGIPPEAVSPSGYGKTFLELEWGEWDNTLAVNLSGVLNCTKAVLSTMVEQKYGKIINIMSDAGRVGEPRLAPYSAAKAGIGGFTKALAKEVGRYCINVNAVSLGTVPGPTQIGRYSAEEWKKRLEAMVKVYPMGRGLGRLGTPKDAADMVTFLASDNAQWITGQIISVSGGYSTVG